MSFEDSETDWFNWLYIDSQKLIEVCSKEKLKAEVLTNGGDFNYLIKITA